MDIEALATRLNDLNNEIDYLKMDLLADQNELKRKESEKRNVLNELLFYNEFKELYENSEKYQLDSKLLYPFKESMDAFGKKVFLRKDSEEYKDDVNEYLKRLEESFKNGNLDKETYVKMSKSARTIANRQLDRIEEEEKKQENKMDLDEEHTQILREISSTKKSFIVNQIGEETYSALGYKYKNMQEVERKELLHKTNQGLCKEMGESCDIHFSKYDLKETDTVSKDGYCIKTKDINTIPYPLDTILLEQTYKLYIHKILNDKKYSERQKEALTKALCKSLSKEKDLIQEKIKKRELTPYGC